MTRNHGSVVQKRILEYSRLVRKHNNLESILDYQMNHSTCESDYTRLGIRTDKDFKHMSYKLLQTRYFSIDNSMPASEKP